MRAIFFLAMPPDLATLSRLSFMAQQMLLPLFLQRDAALQSIKLAAPKADVQSYVTSRTARIASAMLRVGLGSHYAVPEPAQCHRPFPCGPPHTQQPRHLAPRPPVRRRLCAHAVARGQWCAGHGVIVYRPVSAG